MGQQSKAEGAARINVHHHFLFPAHLSAIADHLPPGRGRQRAQGWSPKRDIEQMDAAGIAVTIGSVPIPGIWFGDTEASQKMARRWNDDAAEVVHDHPDRFGFFAAIAPPDIEGSLAEIARSLDELEADGIALLSSYDGRWLGDPVFMPVMRELDRRKAVVFVHPASLPEDAGPPGIRSHVLEGSFDTTRAIFSLLGSGTLSRCPDIRFIFAHGGGCVPYLAGRAAALSSGAGDMERDRMSQLLAGLYFDTALVIDPPALAALTAFAGPTRILLGTDSPIMPPERAIAAWSGISLDPDLRRRIEQTNTVALLPRLGFGKVTQGVGT